MKNTWSATETDWQGVDDEPIAGSDNLVKSGGVYSVFEYDYNFSGSINNNGQLTPQPDDAWKSTDFIPVVPGLRYKVNGVTGDQLMIAFYDKDKVYISGSGIPSVGEIPIEIEGEIPVNCYYVRGSNYMNILGRPSFAIFAEKGIAEAVRKVISNADEKPMPTSDNLVKSGGVFNFGKTIVPLSLSAYNQYSPYIKECYLVPDNAEKLEQLIAEFHLEKVRKSLGDQLSGGERRRCEIARCLAIEPKFIMLDEPFAGVDPIAVEDIQNIVAKLKDKNIGILITDHNVHETLSITDRAYMLFEGKIMFQGTAEELAANEVVREKYLGSNFELRKINE
jgi:ABC-type Na+ transport system ATPase subunit NatA